MSRLGRQTGVLGRVGWAGAARAVAVAAGAGLLAAALVGTAGAQQAPDQPRAFDVEVTASVLEAGAPVSVAATQPAAEATGLLAHGVRVTWNDALPAELGDERFTNHVAAEDGEGDLVIAGRGCGAQWSEAEQEVIHPCTLDLRIIPVQQGDTHEYPVWIHPQVGPLSLEAGTYVVDQVVHWWRPNAEDNQQQFTVRLTYEVTERPAPLDVSVEATVVETGAPVSVAATSVSTNAQGLPAHGVRVTWQGSTPATLDDARFTHDVTAQAGTGRLLTAGRGCSASFDSMDDQIVHVCQDDLLIIDLAQGETHEYPVVIYPQVDTASLAPGTYVVEETIGWRPTAGGERQEFTVRLTYTVTAGVPGQTGTLTPEPAASGASLATWSGGPVTQLPAAQSYWVTAEGEFLGYVPGAPSFVNARFLALFSNGHIPAGTTLVVIR